MVAGGLLLGPPHAPAARRATSLPAPTTGFRLVPNKPSCGGGRTSPPALVAGQVFLPRQQDDANRARADEYACSRRQVEPPCGPVKSTRSRSDTGPVRYDPSAAAAGGIDGGRTTRPRRRLHRPLRPVWWRTTLRRCGGQTGGDGTRLTAAEAGQARPTGLTRAWWRPEVPALLLLRFPSSSSKGDFFRGVNGQCSMTGGNASERGVADDTGSGRGILASKAGDE